MGSGSRDPPREFLLAPVRGPYSNRLLLRFDVRELRSGCENKGDKQRSMSIDRTDGGADQM